MGCYLFLYYYCIFHYVVSTYLNSQCSLQRHYYNEGCKSMAGQETGPTVFTSDHILKNARPCFFSINQLILQQDIVTCWSFFLIQSLVLPAADWMCAYLQIGMSLLHLCYLRASIWVCYFSQSERAKSPLTIKIVFKLNLREADVTSWWTVLRYRDWQSSSFAHGADFGLYDGSPCDIQDSDE